MNMMVPKLFFLRGIITKIFGYNIISRKFLDWPTEKSQKLIIPITINKIAPPSNLGKKKFFF